MQDTNIPIITRILGEIRADENIGFGCVPDQIRKRSVLEGFYLNILATGRRGLGTTTLVNSMFQSPLVDKDRDDDINIFKNEIVENEISLNTSITTYHEEDVDKIIKYLDERNDEYFEAEQGLKRPNLDPRIHVCLYMIAGDQITKKEIVMMKEISKKCNLIPLISKADCFTAYELKRYKDKINRILLENDIKIFYPECSEDDDNEFMGETNEMINRYPLAVFSSMDLYEVRGEMRRGRMYVWGFLDIENDEVNDFSRLRRIIIHNHLDDLIFYTDTIFYNAYRKKNMESERLDEALRKNRLLKIKKEMEKILEERNRKKIEKINSDLQRLEEDFNNRMSLVKKEKILNDAINSQL